MTAANNLPVDTPPFPLNTTFKYNSFTQSGAYLGINGVTDSDGQKTFRLAAGDYKFRSDYQGSQYWSVEETLIADLVNAVDISTGGGAFSFSVIKGADAPLGGVNCYVFTEAGSYLGITSTTDIDGNVVFNLADGRYKYRVDYLGYEFWSDVYEVPTTLSDTLLIDHQDIYVTINSAYQETHNPIEGVQVYLFTPSDTYMNLVETTDNIGQVVFSLPNLPYKVRADYMTRQYWSEEFTGQNTTINIPMADAEVNVSWNGYGLENVPVYVYSESASYLGILGWTDSDGNAVFRLPAATHEFRADYLGGQYWSGEAVLQSGIVNPVIIYTGGGTFNLTVLKDQQAQTPLIGEKTYLFNDSDLYLEISNTTNEFGQLSFDLPEGLFKFRIDTLGYQFWTGLYDVPQILSDEFTIPHQDVTITVQGLDPDPTALAGVNVYLFTPADFYLGLNLLTDSNGQAVFNLPDRQYKVRADFLDHQFWSDVFQWQDTTVSINRGIAELHVNRDGVNIVGAMVYLFSESGSYLGQLQMTDENGAVQFLLPDRPYKFRIDEGGNQYWSDSVQVAPDQTNIVDIDLAPPTVNITADPATILTGNLTALTWSTTNAHSCTIEPGIGDVSVNGSVDVSPAATTTYTITAAGPGGTAVASVKVFVGVSTQADFISLVIDHNKIDENLTNFPVLLKLSDNSGVGGFDASNMLNELMPSVDANDEFHGGNGEFPNSNLWSSNGYPDYVSIQSDKLNIRIDSIDAWNEVHSKDTYRLRGDFDIQVDFEVVAGPGITRWHAFLGVRTDSGHYSRIERYYSDTQGGHGYRHLSFDGSSWCTEGLVNRSDPSGRLRLIRAGSIFESYAWFDDRWNLIATGDDFETTEDVYVQIVLSGDGDKPYAEVNFDNFQINYASVGSVEHRKKFAVYDANGRQCYAEIENWDPFEKAARLWVNVPDVSATEGTTLKIYFDLDMQAQDTKPPEKSNDEFEIENQGIPTPELWWTGGQPTVQAGKLRLHSTGPLQRIRSKWYAQGDFDIRHDFELIQNPAVNRWNFVLRLVTSDGKIVQIYYRYWDGYEYIFNSYDGSSWSTSGSVELYLKVVFKGKGGVSTGRLLAAVNRPH